MNFLFRKYKRFFFIFSLLLFLTEKFFCESWILAAQKFDFVSGKSLNSTEQDLSSIIPQLIMEKISEGLSRNTTPQEMLDRSLNNLLVERQSLFLQLSKEIKTRDAIFLSSGSKRRIQKKILVQEKKIDEIKNQIDENLEKTHQLYDEFKNTNSSQEEKVESSFSPLPFNPLKNLFVKKKSPLLPETQNENVSFYKENAYELFSPSKEALDSGIESRKFENEVVAAKINGLISGSIIVYGEYFSISCALYNFPGKKILGQVTEIGSLKNYISVAENAANYFVPIIVNSFPVEIRFEIQPPEVFKDAIVSVDGNVYKNAPEKIFVPSGNHSITIEASGYIPRSINYNFEGSKIFKLQGNMKLKSEVSSSIELKKNWEKGFLYSGSDLLSEISDENSFAKISFDGTPVIGQFKSTQDENALFFFYVPEILQKNQARLSVKGKAVNHSEYIDKRRIAAYRAYTALVLSVPFTLYSVGKNNSVTNAYNQGSLKDYDEVLKWRRYGTISSGITFACLGFFGFELARYLIAANSLLPSNAKEIPSSEISDSVWTEIQEE